MIILKDILVATDFSDASVTALAYGRELAAQFGATLHVLNVADTFFRVAGIEASLVNVAGLARDMGQIAQRRLDEMVSGRDREKLRAKVVVRLSSAPAMTIVDYIKESDIGLVVIGTHGHGRLAHLLAGGVVDQVVRLAPCPVLVVRHPEHEFVTEASEHLASAEERHDKAS